MTISSFNNVLCPLPSEWKLYRETSLCRYSIWKHYIFLQSWEADIWCVDLGNPSYLFFSIGYSRGFDWINLLQEKLALKDFNIENEAQGLDKAVIKNFTAIVTNKVLMIRFHWAGKGTTAAPNRGIYGPLVSAISVESGKCIGVW